LAVLAFVGLTGIAIGRAEAQHALSAMPGSAESAPNRRQPPDAQIEAGLKFLSLFFKPQGEYK
jgi:hypothetical protein